MIPEVLELASKEAQVTLEDHPLAYSFKEGNGVHCKVMVECLVNDRIFKGMATHISPRFLEASNPRWGIFINQYMEYTCEALENIRRHPMEVTSIPSNTLCFSCATSKTCTQSCTQQTMAQERQWLAELRNLLSYSAHVLVADTFYATTDSSLFRFPLVPNGVYVEPGLLPAQPVPEIKGDEGVDLWRRE